MGAVGGSLGKRCIQIWFNHQTPLWFLVIAIGIWQVRFENMFLWKELQEQLSNDKDVFKCETWGEGYLFMGMWPGQLWGHDFGIFFKINCAGEHCWGNPQSGTPTVHLGWPRGSRWVALSSWPLGRITWDFRYKVWYSHFAPDLWNQSHPLPVELRLSVSSELFCFFIFFKSPTLAVGSGDTSLITCSLYPCLSFIFLLSLLTNLLHVPSSLVPNSLEMPASRFAFAQRAT